MKKIMFNDHYGLTEAVLDLRKTMTRRIITCPKSFKGEWVAGFHVYRRQSDNAILEYPCMYDADERDFDGGQILPRYKLGEIIAVAQSYKDIGLDPDTPLMEANGIGGYVRTELSPGWTNKMFVRADLMPHQIRITNVRVERLQDISDEDCIKEGVEVVESFAMLANGEKKNLNYYRVPIFCKSGRILMISGSTPREAFAALIDRISGKGTWESNPFVFAYEFELVK